MPPPLNIVVFIFTCIVWIFNFILSACCYQKLNIYAYLHYDTFEIIRNRTYACGPYPVWIAIVLWTLFIIGVSITDDKDVLLIVAILAVGLLLFIFIIYMFGEFICNTCYSKYLCCCCKNPFTRFRYKYFSSR
eukprot:374673_1